MDCGSVFAEVALTQLSIESTESGADHHAELTAVVQADVQFDVARCRSGYQIFTEPQAQCDEQGAQFLAVQVPAPGTGGLLEEGCCHGVCGC